MLVVMLATRPKQHSMPLAGSSAVPSAAPQAVPALFKHAEQQLSAWVLFVPGTRPQRFADVRQPEQQEAGSATSGVSRLGRQLQ